METGRSAIDAGLKGEEFKEIMKSNMKEITSSRCTHRDLVRLERADAWRNVEFVETHMALDPGGESACSPLAGGWLIYAWPEAPLNRGVGIGLEHEVTERDLKTLEEFYRDRGASPELYHAPFAAPVLPQLLELRGFHLMDYLNVLARPIGDDHVQGEDERIVIRAVQRDEAQAWGRLVARGFCDGDEPAPSDLELFTIFPHMPSALCFQAEIDGEDAGGGMLFIHDGVALLGGTSVLPRFRGSGVHAALIHARLARAAGEGCDLATTSAQPGSTSQRNMERHGFEVVYRRRRSGRSDER